MSSSSLVPNPSASALVTLDRVAARTPDGHTLFSDLSLAFGRERTGVVGRNGAGKTTLLRLIAGLTTPGEGTVVRAGRVGFLEQAVGPSGDGSVADALGVSAGLTVVRRVLAGDGSPDDLAEADWTLEERIAAALAEVGLADLDPARAAGSLSGGEQTRLRLAALLMDQPDLLVLDEPTNHLDREGRRIVAGVLERWKGGAVVVSHDRGLLRPMDRIVEISSLGAATLAVAMTSTPGARRLNGRRRSMDCRRQSVRSGGLRVRVSGGLRRRHGGTRPDGLRGAEIGTENSARGDG